MFHLSHYQHPTTALTICLPGSFRHLTVAWATRYHLSCPTQVTTPVPRAKVCVWVGGDTTGFRCQYPRWLHERRHQENHMLRSPASASLGLTGLLQVTVGTLKDGIPGSGGNTPLSAWKDLIPRQTMHQKHLTYNTVHLRSAAERFGMPDTRAFAPLIGGFTPRGGPAHSLVCSPRQSREKGLRRRRQHLAIGFSLPSIKATSGDGFGFG